MRLFKRKGKTPAKGADAGDAKGQVDAGDAIRRFVKLTNEIADLAAMITKCFDEINEVMQIFVEPGADGQQADGAQQEGTV